MEDIRTDLAIEAHEMCTQDGEQCEETPGIAVSEYGDDDVYVTEIRVENETGASAIGKPVGTYITIEAPRIKYSEEVYENTCLAISREIKKLCNIDRNTKTLVVGLGNDTITPDALGPEVVSGLMVTNHIKTHLADILDESYSSVCALIPGVLGTTGIESTDIIKGVCDRIKPEIVICVDALAARSASRISTTFQLSDTGISPGSGVENKRKEINERTIGAKVIAIGVPTVVDAATIASDSIDAALERAGGFGKEDKREIIKKALTENAGNMMVTPKDIDLVIKRAAKTVANGINLALHRDLTFRDIENYVG